MSWQARHETTGMQPLDLSCLKVSVVYQKVIRKLHQYRLILTHDISQSLQVKTEFRRLTHLDDCDTPGNQAIVKAKFIGEWIHLKTHKRV